MTPMVLHLRRVNGWLSSPSPMVKEPCLRFVVNVTCTNYSRKNMTKNPVILLEAGNIDMVNLSTIMKNSQSFHTLYTHFRPDGSKQVHCLSGKLLFIHLPPNAASIPCAIRCHCTSSLLYLWRRCFDHS